MSAERWGDAMEAEAHWEIRRAEGGEEARFISDALEGGALIDEVLQILRRMGEYGQAAEERSANLESESVDHMPAERMHRIRPASAGARVRRM